MNIAEAANYMNTTADDYLHFLRKFHPWGTKNHKQEIKNITNVLVKHTEIPYRHATNHKIQHDTAPTATGVGTIEPHIQQFLTNTNQCYLKCIGDGHCLRRAIAKRLEMQPGHLINLLIEQMKTLLQNNPRGLQNEAHVITYTNNQANNIKQAMWGYMNNIKKIGASHFLYDNKQNHTPNWGGDLEIRMTAILTGIPVAILTNHPTPNKLITIHWPSIETRAWHNNQIESIQQAHQLLQQHYTNVLYVLYNNRDHYNAIIPNEIQHPNPYRTPIMIRRRLPLIKQLQQYLAESQITSALSLSLDLLTATTQHHAEFASSKPDSTPNTPAEGCVESSSLSSLSAQENEAKRAPQRKKRKTKRSLSLADSDDSDDDSTQPSAGMFGVELGSDNTNPARHCVVTVQRSNDNDSADVTCDSEGYCCNCTTTNRLQSINTYHSSNSLITHAPGTCFKTTITEIRAQRRPSRKHKPAQQPQTDNNFHDLSHSPKKNNNIKRTRIIEDTSSDEEHPETATLTKKKQKHKHRKEKYPDPTPTNITTELKQSAILSTKDHGWNSTMGRRIHIPEPDEN